MSKNSEQEKAIATGENGIELTVTLKPALSLHELIEFHQLATQNGESPAERLARLIRKDADAAAA